MLIDTHCHLDAREFDADRDAVMARALDAGVCAIVVPSVERANFGAVASVCRDYAACLPAYGIHPLYVPRAGEEDIDVLADILGQGGGVAIGEIGLDFYEKGMAGEAVARQEQLFARQLKLARDLDLPVLLHVRGAIDAVLKHLRRVAVPGGIAHAFNGSLQQAQTFIAMGFKLGFGGAMTYPQANRLRRLATTLPLDSLVLETDAPDIPPEWLARGRNEPGELKSIASSLARYQGITLDDAVTITGRNARQIIAGLGRIAA